MSEHEHEQESESEKREMPIAIGIGETLLERYAQCEVDIAMLNVMLKGYTDDPKSMGLGLHEPLMRSIRRAEEERERLRAEYEGR